MRVGLYLVNLKLKEPIYIWMWLSLFFLTFTEILKAQFKDENAHFQAIILCSFVFYLLRLENIGLYRLCCGFLKRWKFTSAFRYKDLDWCWHGIWWFAGVVARVLRCGLCNGEPGLGVLSKGSYRPSRSPSWGEHRHAPFLVIVDHTVVVIPKHISMKNGI